MEKWVERYKPAAAHILESGYVKEIDFSGPTYQVEVFDEGIGESRWPFLQFDEHALLKDAFCTCPSDNGKCVHLAAAYLAILGAKEIPLHIRFEHSFWNELCQILGESSGYEERFLEKRADGHYLFQNEIGFEIEALKPAAKQFLTKIVENRLRETPENSIKFSNLSQEEITRWREGRPSRNLRYLLSFWFDLGKWMMRHAKEGKLRFEEDAEGYPTTIFLEFPQFLVRVTLQKKDLPKLVPTLNAVHSPLKVFQSEEEKVKNITFDSKTMSFHIEHTTLVPKEHEQKALPLEGWIYIPDLGFYPQDGHSFLGRTHVPKEEASPFLKQCASQIARYIPVQEKKVSLSYAMHFDTSWNWHFSAWLFEKGDLESSGSCLLEGWVYLKEKGFYPILNDFFGKAETVLKQSEVSSFVNHHRIWLNGQQGFQTHLASIESQLSYTVTKNQTLAFHTKFQAKSFDLKDFGDWIYYNKLGFFSKKHARLEAILHPGLEIEAQTISHFIKTNREELETISTFFTPICPLLARGLDIEVKSPTLIQIKPVFTLKSDYKESQIAVFGDFVYLHNAGFCELPISMRLPEKYLKPVNISGPHLVHFFEEEFENVLKYCQKIDTSLKVPHKLDFVVDYLVRSSGKGLRAELLYHTEFGTVHIGKLMEAIENKRRYCFTDGGLFDLHDERFQWLKNFKASVDPQSNLVDLSALDLIRLDATFGLLGPKDSSQEAEITRKVLKELREFSSHETPNLKGLSSTLRLYQQTGLQWLWFLYKNGLSGLLCDDMGLGKTHQSMALIAAALNQKGEGPRKLIVVCPTSVIYHWQDKLATFLPHLKVHTFHGPNRTLKRMPREGIILTSYGILRVEKEALGKIPFELAIFDEIQIAKNPRSRVHEALKSLQTRMRIGLSGTPIENNLKELKSLFDIVLPGYMPSEAKFRELFIIPIEKNSDPEKKALLSQLIRPFVMRRKKSEVLEELPEKIEDKSYCELSEDQQKLYVEILAKSRDNLLQELRDQDKNINYVHIFSLLSQLKQVCDHPALVHKDPKNYKSYSSGKWDLFVELLEEARSSDQKVVVFSQYLYMLDIIENYLKEKEWGYAQIRGDTLNRPAELKRFQEDPTCVVFIGSLQAAGLGIDLTSANVVVLYDRWWNAARENQAIDRVHRIGQQRGVQVYKLITKNTIEEKIDQMITRKGRLLEEVVLVDDQAVLKKFTRTELIDLLSFHEP